MIKILIPLIFILTAHTISAQTWVKNLRTQGYHAKPCPEYTTASRDALISASLTAGACIYNTDSDILNWYRGASWETSAGDFSELGDVSVTNPASSDLLMYDASNSVWFNIDRRIVDHERLGDGMSIQRPEITILATGDYVYAELEASGGGNIKYHLEGAEVEVDCTTGGGTDGKAMGS